MTHTRGKVERFRYVRYVQDVLAGVSDVIVIVSVEDTHDGFVLSYSQPGFYIMHDYRLI